MEEKRGFFFSVDALIALALIFLVLVVFYPIYSSLEADSELPSDVLTVLSSLKVEEINNAYVQTLIDSGEINNPTSSLLEQIGEFSVYDVDMARAFAENMMSELEFGNENFGIWVGNKLIYSKNITSIGTAEKVVTSRRFISSLKQGENVTGFAARASLASGLRQDYFYFGGYVGDGNVSLEVDYSGTISSAELEIAIDKDFVLYVNTNTMGSYEKSSSEFTPERYSLPVDSFVSGANVVELRGDDLYVAGGFVKIVYNSDVVYEQPERYYFPGIEGVVNLYDGFYVPGEIEGMSISLHLDSPEASPFLNLGDVAVYEGNTTGEETITILNSELSSLLDYASLSRETVPIRLGLRNASFTGETRDIDVFSVTDLSGSMCGTCSGAGFWCCLFSGGCNNNQPNCESCGGICQSMAYDSKDANKLFVDIILNTSNSRIGLVGYKEQAYAEDYHALSRDVVSLKDKIDSWQAVGATCICCGVNSAVDDLVSDSTSDKFRSLIVMSDGQANRPCSEQGGGSATQNAIQSACDAYNNHGIVVYTIGFGPQADEATLESMAQCANGTYTYSTIEGLEQIYQQIANEILTTYAEQTVDVAGGVYMKLFPDSYIEFDYNNTVELYGLVITAEEEFDNAYSGSFYVPSGAEVLEVEVASYSGPRWTDNVKIDGNDVYMLSDYGSDYILLGDPYIINIPASLVFEGDNFVNVTTGTSPTNSSAGSESNKIIYTLKRNASAFSDIEPVAYGCNWRIQFEDDSDMEVTIPSSYVDGSVCVYNETSHDLQDWNDAYNSAVWELLSNLDLDSDGKIDLIFTEQQLEISLSETSGIPIVLEAEVQARIWY